MNCVVVKRKLTYISDRAMPRAKKGQQKVPI